MVIKPEVKDKVLGKIDEKRDEMVKFLRDLVRVPSVSKTAEVGKAQQVVAKKFEEAPDLRIDIWEPEVRELEKYPLYPLRWKPWDYRNRPNVVGVVEGSENGPSIILNGHIDVVSPEPVKAWKYDPWSAKIEKGKLYGRGSCDCKGGIAAMTYAVLSILDAGIKVKGRVILESVVEEEYGGGGTIATLLKGYKAESAIVTEGTGSQGLCLGVGGSRFFTIKVLGKSEIAHLSHLGVNAISLASKLCGALWDLNDHRVRKLEGKDPHFEKFMRAHSGDQLAGDRPTSLCLGVLRAGDWPTTVAGWAEIQGRAGFPPSEKGEDVVKEIEETIGETADLDSWMKNHRPLVQWWGPRKEGYMLSSEEPIVRKVKHYAEEITGTKCDPYATPTNSDVNYLTPKVGAYGGIPAIMYGPGGANAHKPDEYVKIDELLTVAQVLALTILDWCGYES